MDKKYLRVGDLVEPMSDKFFTRADTVGLIKIYGYVLGIYDDPDDKGNDLFVELAPGHPFDSKDEVIEEGNSINSGTKILTRSSEWTIYDSTAPYGRNILKTRRGDKDGDV